MTCLVNSHNIYIVSVERHEPGRRVGECTATLDLQICGVLILTQFSSVTLVGEADRKMLKAAIKHSAGEDQVRHRVVPPATVAKFAAKLESLKSDITEVMKEETEEKQVRGGDAPPQHHTN